MVQLATASLYRDRRGETYNLIYDPGQRWFYAPPRESIELRAFVIFGEDEQARH